MSKHDTKTATRFDALIIGGGHNGLICAAYLAKAGKKVCVLERRHVLGGCATTESLWPGYKVSTAAYVISLLLPQIIRDLRLKYYGLNILPRTPSSFTPLLDGRSLTLGPDAQLNRREISKFSQRDANAYPKYNALLERVAHVLEPVLSQSAPDPLPLPKEFRAISVGKKMRDAAKLYKLYGAMGELGDDLPEAIELLTGAARPILERWFETEVLRATLATDAVIGAFAAPSMPGTAYVLLHHVMGEAGGARGVWGYVQGGMGGLADALEKACDDLHVTIVREAAVREIVAEHEQVYGVLLEDGRNFEAPIVASSVDAHLTFERFLSPAALPEEFRAAVKRIDYASASMKINLALSEPPNFTALPSTGIAPHHHGTMHISPTLDFIERAYDDAKYGRPSSEPVLEMTLPTSVDRTFAPDGKHIMSIFVQYAPYKLAAGSWDNEKEKFADRCVEQIARYAPNFPASIEHRQVLSPLDLERTYGLTGGNIMQGAMVPHQLFALRPIAGWADHRTPINGLYLCGAASHPGGGVMGACGMNAAVEILRDN
jgi:phytoene dehydrogenase-like protein